MKIHVYTKNVYGVERHYVAGEVGENIYHLTGRKTLDRADIKALTGMGHEVTFHNGQERAEHEAEREK